MANWKKLLYSGSVAELSSLSLDNPLTVPNGGTGLSSVTSGYFLRGNGTGNLTLQAPNGTGNVVLTDGATLTNMVGSGSFSGSFQGDGSGLTGVTASYIAAPGLNTEVIFNNGGDLGTDADFTFASNTLTVNGSTFSAAIDVSSTATIGNLTGGSNSNNVIIDGGSGLLRSRAIDARVWGTTLVDAANGVNNRIATFTDSNSLNGEANLTFDGSTLAVTGALTVTGATTLGDASGDSVTINAATIDIGNVAAGTDNTVLIRTSAGNIAHDEIDSKVWGGSLIDGSGAATRVAYWSDSDSLTSDGDFTYNGTNNELSISGSTFGHDTIIGGNLTVLGDTITADVSNLLIEDRFILLNSGSAAGDGGIIVQTEVGFEGVALGWDDSEGRFGVQLTSALSQAATAISPDAYVALAVSGSGADAEHQKLGNIRTDGDEIYIWA